jgi:DNA polymerase III delta prime subunit
MFWTEYHAHLLSKAFERVLSKPESGAMAFVRCLTPDVVRAMARDVMFAPTGWAVRRVAESQDKTLRTIAADQAVELREAKGEPVLLLVDTAQAGAGMDGIYSAAQEVDETALFEEALRLAAARVTESFSRATKLHAEQALKVARRHRRYSVSRWTEFDYFVRIVSEKCHPGDLLYLLGLWPVHSSDDIKVEDALINSRLFVDRLLGSAVSGLTPAQRIESLKLYEATDKQKGDLERFLRDAAAQPLLLALEKLADLKHLWINELRMESAAKTVQSIEWIPWRTGSRAVARWCGLTDGDETGAPAVLILDPDAQKSGVYSKLEVRWKARPDNLPKGATDYHVVILTDMDEELASREVPHSGKKEEKCRFTNDDFSLLNDDALVSAKIAISVVGNDEIEPVESEEFLIRFGEPQIHEPAGVGKKVRCFSEGLMELEDRDLVTEIATSTVTLPEDTKGYVLLRTPQRSKSFRVYRPPLLREVEQQWTAQGGAIGRWRVKVRASGARASAVEFVSMIDADVSSSSARQSLWDRTAYASKRMAERFNSVSGVGQIYDDRSKQFDSVVKPYVLAWAALLEEGDPMLALAHTVEVQTLSGRIIGLIVLPSHPLRIAWHVAYDNLVLYSAFEQNVAAKEILDGFRLLDGAMFPAFLPGLTSEGSFVFTDMLGFHSVAMVPDHDKEPKAAVAILARAIGESDAADSVPTVGKQSAQVLGGEIRKYIECHGSSNILHVHALRPGDGLTVARSLGQVHEGYRAVTTDEEAEETNLANAPSFVLELYPSHEQRGVAGRFIAEAREKRRRGAGVLAQEDRWMLESLSLPGGARIPKLRWARKIDQEPKGPAHLAVAFDTFESRVIPAQIGTSKHPYYAFGLLSFFDRTYTSLPSPLWLSSVRTPDVGEKHPSDRIHTDRLMRLQNAVTRTVVRSLNGHDQWPVLRTEISPEKSHNLRELHRLCDWVITLDRNAGIEYFDSPRDNPEIYDTYVIDAVPEREDLGCLQLITSTANLEEVRNLLDGALDQMGLSRSRRNAEFLLEHLKALSGRLAIRLTGRSAPNSELIALAMSRANCHRAVDADPCWTPLDNGFLIPVDDVLDLIPPLTPPGKRSHEENTDVPMGNARPDLIYVSVVPRKGLSFQFIEVKYRRHLRASRNPELLESILRQVQSLRKRWDSWYVQDDAPTAFRALRRAKLARVLRFYVDKAYRHTLSKDRYEAITTEIDRMIEKGSDYTFAAGNQTDRGWVFCPEFAGGAPLDITPTGWDTRIFLFGPGQLPDIGIQRKLDAPFGSTETQGDAAGTMINGANTTNGAEQIGRARSEAPAGSTVCDQDAEQIDPAIVLGSDLFTRVAVSWPLTTKGNPHLLLAGLPGMGKTTCLLNLCSQMLVADVRPIVFSYHQDIDERLAQSVKNVRFLDYQGLGFNPLQVIDRQSPMAYLDVAGAVRDIFVAIYPELGDIQGEKIRRAIKESFIEEGWSDPNADRATLTEPPFGRFVEILHDDPKPDRSLQTLLVRLDELSDYGFFDRNESMTGLWDSDGPTIIRIHTTANDNLQKAFASLVFYRLYKDMFRRGLQTRITHTVIFDEAHRAARLHLLPTMAKECRKYGISLVVASQEARDFNASLFSTIANYLVLRLNETDAKSLVRNVSSSDLERTLIDKIKQMDRFKAFYFTEGKNKPSLVALSP